MNTKVDVDLSENAPVSAEGIQGSREKDEDARRAEALDRRIVRTKLESWRIQLKECKATERERIVFGKVSFWLSLLCF